MNSLLFVHCFLSRCQTVIFNYRSQDLGLLYLIETDHRLLILFCLNVKTKGVWEHSSFNFEDESHSIDQGIKILEGKI